MTIGILRADASCVNTQDTHRLPVESFEDLFRSTPEGAEVLRICTPQLDRLPIFQNDNEISRDAGREIIADVVDIMVSGAVILEPGYGGKLQQSLIKVTVGGGKSDAAWKKVAETCIGNPDFRVLVRLQSHQKAAEAEHDLLNALRTIKPELTDGELQSMAQRWIGAGSPDPRVKPEDGKPKVSACQNDKLVATVRSAGGVTSDACAICPLADACFYVRQDARDAQIVIVAGDVTLSSLPSKIQRRNKQDDQEHFDLVVIDETSPVDLLSIQTRGTDIEVLTQDIQALHDAAEAHVAKYVLERTRAKHEPKARRAAELAVKHEDRANAGFDRIIKAQEWVATCKARMEKKERKLLTARDREKAAAALERAQRNYYKALDRLDQARERAERHGQRMESAESSQRHHEQKATEVQELPYDHSENVEILQQIRDMLHLAAQGGHKLTAEAIAHELRGNRLVGSIESAKIELEELKSRIWKAVVQLPSNAFADLDAAPSAEDNDPGGVVAPISALLNAVKSISGILSALIQGLEDALYARDPEKGIPHLELRRLGSTESDTGKTRSYARMRSKLSRQIAQVPTIILDASGDPEALQPWWPDIFTAADVRIEDGAGVRRILCTDSQVSKGSMEPSRTVNEQGVEIFSDGGRNAQMRNSARAALFHHLRNKQLGGQGALILHAVSERFLASVSALEGVLHGHHGAMRGINEMKNCRHLEVIGRNRPKDEVIELYAELIFRRRIDIEEPQNDRGNVVELFPEHGKKKRSSGRKAKDRIQPQPKEITLRDGRVVAIWQEAHPEPYCERIRSMLVNDELYQEDGRARAVNRDESTPVDITLLTASDPGVKVDEVFSAKEYDAVAGWIGGLLLAGIWPLGNGNAGLRAQALRTLVNQSPWMTHCVDVPEEGQDAQKFFENKRRDNGVKDLCKLIDEAAVKGQAFSLLHSELDMVGWHRLKIRPAGGGRGGICFVEGETVDAAMVSASELFPGAEIAHEPDDRSASCHNEGLRPLNRLIVTTKANEGSKVACVATQCGNSTETRHETVLACFEEFGLVPGTAAHAIAIAPHIWPGRRDADRPLKTAHWSDARDGEIVVAYKWGAGRQKSKAKAIVQADNMQEAIEILQRAMPGAEILDAETKAPQVQEPAIEDTGRPEPVEKCFAEFGFVPASPAHAAAIAPHIWVSDDSAKDYVQRIKPAADEFQVHYRWAAPGSRRRLSYAIVRAGTLEEARAKLLAALTGAEIVRKPSEAC
ncbi:hypothetical protein ROS1_28480 [Roseibium sp. ROS1]